MRTSKELREKLKKVVEFMAGGFMPSQLTLYGSTVDKMLLDLDDAEKNEKYVQVKNLSIIYSGVPVPMILNCPRCGMRHIDRSEERRVGKECRL